MAMSPIMIPDYLGEVEKGEALVHRYLRRSLPDNYWVWHELKVRGKRDLFRPDFVVLGPDLGVTVVEVKGWKTESVVNADQHFFYLRGEDKRQNPIEQARDYHHGILDALRRKRERALVHLSGPHEGRLRFPILYFVAFPRISRGEYVMAPWARFLDEDHVLFQEDLSTDLLGHLLANRPLWFEKSNNHLNRSQIDLIRAVLYPEVEVRPPYEGEQIALLDPEQEQIMKSHSYLSEEGQRTARELDVRMVRGVAGSGKSLIVIRRAQFLAQSYSDWRILVLTYNRPLAHYLEQLNVYTGEETTQIEIMHFHRWCHRLLGPIGEWREPISGPFRQELITKLLTVSGFEFDAAMVASEFQFIKGSLLTRWEEYKNAPRTGRQRGLGESQRYEIFTLLQNYQRFLISFSPKKMDWDDPPLLILRAIANGRIAPHQYHAILIDEAQDFAPSWLKVAQEMLKPETNLLFLAADGAQRIYKRSGSWLSMGIDVRGQRTRILRKSYRNTYQIMKAASEVIRGDDSVRESLVRQGDELLEPDYQDVTMRNGPIPVFVGFDDPAKEFDYIVDQIHNLLANGYHPQDILVTHRHNDRVKELATALQGSGLVTSLLGEEDYDPRKKSIKVCTMHKTKGLEFRVVFICGVDCLNEDHLRSAELSEEEWEEILVAEKQLIYVGMTRARDCLYITYTGKGPNWLKQTLPIVLDRLSRPQST
ncbi:MAG: NERD domain-containing protein [Anaerolineae bacterium]|nr:NERD domain-containing protein [Anaerolineae bacterium]